MFYDEKLLLIPMQKSDLSYQSPFSRKTRKIIALKKVTFVSLFPFSIIIIYIFNAKYYFELRFYDQKKNSKTSGLHSLPEPPTRYDAIEQKAVLYIRAVKFPISNLVITY